MLSDLYHAEYAHIEYERRVQAHLLERAILKAKATHTAAITERLDHFLRLAARWAMTTRRRGWKRLQQVQG